MQYSPSPYLVSAHTPLQIDLDRASLTPRQRELLHLEGTVTDFLTEHFGEPIKANKLRESIEETDEEDHYLEYSGKIMARSVILEGANSGRRFLHADARLALSRLPASIAQDLTSTSITLGTLLVRDRLNTSRELTHMGTCASPLLAPLFHVAREATWLWRSYRIIADDRPIAHIREQFPLCGAI